jgi:hypothetical protein
VYAIEDGIRGKPSDERRAVGPQRPRPLPDDLERWLHSTLSTLWRKSVSARAVLHALKLWPLRGATATTATSKSTTPPLMLRALGELVAAPPTFVPIDRQAEPPTSRRTDSSYAVQS